MYVSRVKPRHATGKRVAAPTAPAERTATAKKAQLGALLDLNAYIGRHDYVGALTLLRWQQQQPPRDATTGADGNEGRLTLRWWTAYCLFQCGDYAAALDAFEQLLELDTTSTKDKGKGSGERDAWRLSRACCLYYLGQLEDAEREALLSARVPLCNRLLFLIANRRRTSEQVLLERYQQLASSTTTLLEDQLALAFSSYERRNYQEAVDTYKRLILQHREQAAALHVYLAMCYFQLDYYDVSLELLAVYRERHAGSFVAANLKACNQFRLYSGVEASGELAQFGAQYPAHACNGKHGYGDNGDHCDEPTGVRAMFEHNRAIFEEATGTRASSAKSTLAVLAPLVERMPVAKTNLVLAHLLRREYREAFELVEDLEPATPVECAVKGILHAMIGEQTASKEHGFLAEKYFHATGSAASECDTIPGRQCMASYYLVRKEFADAITYLSSIATYFVANDAFNYNYGVALAATGQFAEAEDVLLRVQSERLRAELVYCSWLARACIHNGKRAALAWELYLKMENTADALRLLKLIANDFYRARNFYYAVKAFDVLERLDPDPEYWEAKRGACVGFFQQVALGEEPALAQRCDDVLKLLLASKNVLESNRLGTVLKKWVAQTVMTNQS